MNELEKALAFLSGAPLAVSLMFVLYGGYHEWWVFGPTMRRELAEKQEQIRERDERIAELKALLIEGTSVARAIVEHLEDADDTRPVHSSSG